MNLHELKGKIEQLTGFGNADLDELLVWVKKAYLTNEISIAEYHAKIKEIEQKRNQLVMEN